MNKKIIASVVIIFAIGILAIVLTQKKPAPVPQKVSMTEAHAVAVVPAVTSDPQQKIFAGTAGFEFDNLPGNIKLFSTQMKAGEKMPLTYTCYQKNISPPLGWSDLPQGTKSTVILFEKPEEGKAGKVFWTLYNIPLSISALAEGLPKAPMVGAEAGQGLNDSGNVGYYGPCTPKGEQHYVFRIFALDAVLQLPGVADKNALFNAMKSHVLDKGELPVTHYYRL